MTDRRMDCAEIRDSLLAGSAPTGPEVEAHLQNCETCAELLRDEGTLGRALSKSALPAADSAELWSSIQGALREETWPRAWLRSRATALRLLIAVAVAVAIVALGGRAATGAGPNELPVGWVVAFALVGIVGLAFAVAPLGRPQPAPGARVALAFGALVLPLGYALASRVALASSAPVDLGFAEQAVGCFAYGVFLALPFLFAVWLLERSDRPWLTLLVAVGAVAGLVANAALALHCPNTEPAHLAAGHATIGVAFACLGVLWAVMAARRSRGRPRAID
jgi:predicted anti-sigma-YlaC factor YlaD